MLFNAVIINFTTSKFFKILPIMHRGPLKMLANVVFNVATSADFCVNVFD